ncbi:MAG: protein kinase [Clostridia bacterium]|nr:protein kinase [Clostridia bacterium]
MDNYEKYIGQVFDNRYRIDALIGVGGMAVVYKAVDLLMRRIVAVKILRDDISADDASVKRFINESKAVAMLSHPNIVNIYDVSVRDNVKYIVMEYIEGITLKNYINRREVLGFKETLSYTMQILRALDHAHKKGIVHRDIKPQNIMLLRDGVIKVMDFGIAKLPNADTVTMTDKAIGTVYYISPEQASGGTIDARSDLYSLGVLMYEMTTGRLPFDAESPVSVALMQVNETPENPRSINPKIPTGLEQIIMRAMEKAPAERYQSAEAMLDCLEKLKENPAIVFKPKASDKIKRFFTSGHPLGNVSRSMFPIILGVFVPFLITFCILGVYLFTSVFMDSSINDYETVEVQNFVGAVYTSELEEWFSESEYYRLSSVEYQYSEDIALGEIIGQYPAAGEMKKVLKDKQFCNVKLVLSGGREKVTIKDYLMSDYRLVVSELNRMKVKCTVIKQPSIVQEYGSVLRTVPAAGTTINIGETVEIYVSSGAGDADLLMPDFTDKSEGDVLLEMVQNKLRVGKVTFEKSDKKAGTVIAQSIEPETPVYFYTVVDFVVSGGEKYGEVETTTEETTTEPATESASASESKTEKPDETTTASSSSEAASDEPSEIKTDEPSEVQTDEPSESASSGEPADSSEAVASGSDTADSTDTSSDTTAEIDTPLSSETGDPVENHADPAEDH